MESQNICEYFSVFIVSPSKTVSSVQPLKVIWSHTIIPAPGIALWFHVSFMVSFTLKCVHLPNLDLIVNKYPGDFCILKFAKQQDTPNLGVILLVLYPLKYYHCSS